jgi:hypothetical protein
VIPSRTIKNIFPDGEFDNLKYDALRRSLADEFDKRRDKATNAKGEFYNEDAEDFYENIVCDSFTLFRELWDDEQDQFDGIEEDEIDDFEEKWEDEMDDINEKYGVEDDDWDFTAYCRNEFLLKDGFNRRKRPIFSSYTDIGICLYECIFFIKNCDEYLKKKATRGDIVRNRIVEAFLQEPEELRDAVFRGNPVSLWKLWHSDDPKDELKFNIIFWEMPEMKDYWNQQARFTIVVRRCHAVLFFTEIVAEHFSMVYNASLFEREWRCFELKKMKPESKKFGKDKKGKNKNLKDEDEIKDEEEEKTTEIEMRIERRNFAENECQDSDGTCCEESEEELEGDMLVHKYNQEFDLYLEELKGKKIYELKKVKKTKSEHNIEDPFRQVEKKLIQIKLKALPEGSANKIYLDKPNPFKKKFDIDEFEKNKDIEIGISLDYTNFKFTPSAEDSRLLEFAFDFETLAIDGIFYIYHWVCTNIHNMNERISCWGVDHCKLEWIRLVEFFIDKNHGIMLGSRKAKQVVRFWSYNGGRFDCMFFTPYFVQFYNTKIVGDMKNIKVMTIGNVYFHDLCLIFGGGLENAGKSFADPKLLKKADLIDHKSITIENYDLDPEKKKLITYYCIYDTFCLASCIHTYFKLCKEFDVNRYRFSAAHLAMTVFQTKFYDEEKFPIRGLPPDVYQIVKSSYFGGMCMAFKKEFISTIKPDGERSFIRGYDINSSYPNVLKNFDIPYRFLDKDEKKFKITKDNYQELLEDTKLYCIRGFKFKKEILYPYMGVRDDEGLLWYPLDHSELYVTWGNLIRFGYEYDCWDQDFEMEYSLVFDSGKVFEPYVTENYNRRLEAKAKENVAEDSFLKILLNSLYGKFGQKKLPKKEYLNSEQLRYVTAIGSKAYLYKHCKEVRQDKYIRDQVKKEALERMPKLIDFYGDRSDIYQVEWKLADYPGIGDCVHIASYVTAKARENLMHGVYALTKGRSLDVVYCDTDSVYVIDKELPADMLSDSILGKWKLECKVEYGIFLAPKMYAYHKYFSEQEIEKYRKKTGKMPEPLVMKCKGIRTKFLTPDVFKSLLYAKSIDTNAGDVFKRVYNGVTIKKCIKTIKLKPRRQWMKNGTSIPPLALHNWQLPESHPDLQDNEIEDLLGFAAKHNINMEEFFSSNDGENYEDEIDYDAYELNEE